MTTPAEELRSRLRADLREAMRARRAAEVSVLRTLIAAVDNAEAIPVATGPYVPRKFGDEAVEVLRLELSGQDVSRVIEEEAGARSIAADELERRGRTEEAAALRDEAMIVSRYRS